MSITPFGECKRSFFEFLTFALPYHYRIVWSGNTVRRLASERITIRLGSWIDRLTVSNLPIIPGPFLPDHTQSTHMAYKTVISTQLFSNVTYHYIINKCFQILKSPSISANELITNVFGKTGPWHSDNRARNAVLQIGFVIKDTVTAAARIEGVSKFFTETLILLIFKLFVTTAFWKWRRCVLRSFWPLGFRGLREPWCSRG